jgi:hypothetical protein
MACTAKFQVATSTHGLSQEGSVTAPATGMAKRWIFGADRGLGQLGREFAYARDPYIIKLRRGLDEGPDRGWTITSMKNDWKAIYPDPKR